MILDFLYDFLADGGFGLDYLDIFLVSLPEGVRRGVMLREKGVSVSEKNDFSVVEIYCFDERYSEARVCFDRVVSGLKGLAEQTVDGRIAHEVFVSFTPEFVKIDAEKRHILRGEVKFVYSLPEEKSKELFQHFGNYNFSYEAMTVDNGSESVVWENRLKKVDFKNNYVENNIIYDDFPILSLNISSCSEMCIYLNYLTAEEEMFLCGGNVRIIFDATDSSGEKFHYKFEGLKFSAAGGQTMFRVFRAVLDN